MSVETEEEVRKGEVLSRECCELAVETSLVTNRQESQSIKSTSPRERGEDEGLTLEVFEQRSSISAARAAGFKS
jgi:hypothetical protein